MEKIKNYLLEDINELMEVVREINSYNGNLDYLEAYENDEYFFDDFFTSPYDVLQKTYYGNYDFNDYYVRFDGYGNLESLSEWEYEQELRDCIDEIVENLLDIHHSIFISGGLEELIEEYEAEEAEEE